MTSEFFLGNCLAGIFGSEENAEITFKGEEPCIQIEPLQCPK